MSVLDKWFKKKKGKDESNERLLYTSQNPKSPISEAYRSIRTSIHFATASNEHSKVFLFTSAGPREGKSTVAANLAVTFAQAGSKIILIDCDLRKPVQHRVFGVANTVGLTNVLVDRISPEEAIKATKVPGLDVLTSGPIPPNPSELLSSPRMIALLDQLRQRYDIVLIDSPPTVAVTDSVVISGYVDGIILVIRSGQVTIEMAKVAKMRLEQAKGKIIGTIINGLDYKGEDYYYYYYYYGGSSSKDA